jgi:hypothetical protein
LLHKYKGKIGAITQHQNGGVTVGEVAPTIGTAAATADFFCERGNLIGETAAMLRLALLTE